MRTAAAARRCGTRPRERQEAGGNSPHMAPRTTVPFSSRNAPMQDSARGHLPIAREGVHTNHTTQNMPTWQYESDAPATIQLPLTMTRSFWPTCNQRHATRGIELLPHTTLNHTGQPQVLYSTHL